MAMYSELHSSFVWSLIVNFEPSFLVLYMIWILLVLVFGMVLLMCFLISSLLCDQHKSLLLVNTVSRWFSSVFREMSFEPNF